ncbi:hypothetical protein [Algibacillus agarilyticus]|uniref:hypothetical protein n=1 Tax=Algibacillus agarilyticus TaxID=2234133 RepID=UPI000DD016A0|nr:hypothetical protein [Algibacillus agarilyticus]
MNTLKALITINTLCIILIGCGGGGSETSSEGNSKVSTTVTKTTVTQAPIPQENTENVNSEKEKLETTELIVQSKNTRIEDINVEPNNTLSATFELTVSISGVSDKVYVSLCDEFTEQQNTYSVQYDSCLFRTPVSSSSYSRTLKIANHNTDLVLAVWHYDGRAPQFIRWIKSNELANNLNIAL